MMIKAVPWWLIFICFPMLRGSIRQRICTDAELALLSLQQSIKGSDLDTCIQINPQTNLAKSLSMKSCLMTAGATELCASCFSAINEAFSQCVIECKTSGSQSSECLDCFNTIQASYELTDDQMAQWHLFDICRTGFANERGEIQTTGAPLTTTLPPILMAPETQRMNSSSRSSNLPLNPNHAAPLILMIFLVVL